jgi:hypothetical protein
MAAPARNAPTDTRHAEVEKPDAPATANPRSRMFPVMFAVKTWPRPR